MTAVTRVVPRVIAIALPSPVSVGGSTVRQREYVLVEVECDDGTTGIGYGMRRGAPIEVVIETMLVPALLGRDPDAIDGIWDDLVTTHQFFADGPLFLRAMSLVDIALWDIRGRRLGLPIWRLLGDGRDAVPVQVAGGYPGFEGTVGDLATEVADLVARGFRLIKIAGDDLNLAEPRIRTARDAAPEATLTYDAHWRWTDVDAVIDAASAWLQAGLDRLEDPFPSRDRESIARLRDGSQVPLALGEDLATFDRFERLVDHGLVDLLRFDATVVGGFTGARRVIELAERAQLPASPHVFAEVHQHLAATSGVIEHVEITDPSARIEGVQPILRSWVDIEDGRLVPTTGPGLGVELDHDVLERYTLR